MWYDLQGLNKIIADLDPNEDYLLLDFGHGGNDPGCEFYDGSSEKDYVLRFGLKVYELMKPFFQKIYLTRTTDKTVSLEARTKRMTELASKCKMLHVYSIHCNAFNTQASGTEWLLSYWTKLDHTDYKFCKQFLHDYSKTFNIKSRGIVQKLNKAKKNYYVLHRDTPANCRVKYFELFFGDNRDDCKKGQTVDYFNKATFFLASYILKRYNFKIENKVIESNILYIVQSGAYNELDNAKSLVKSLKSKGFNGIIKKIYK